MYPNSKNDYWTVIVLLLSPLTLASVVWGWQNPLRWVLVFCFLLLCPGMAFEYLLPGKDRITRAFLIVVLSFAIDTTVAQVMLYSGKWMPELILWILGIICWFGVILKFTPNIFWNSKVDFKVNLLYYKFISRGWWLILISMLVAVNLSLVDAYYFPEPMYEAVARFVITLNPQNPADTTTNQKIPDKKIMLSTYADNINSTEIRTTTLELLLENPDDFKDYVTFVTLFPDEDMIRFSVDGPNAETAMVLANSIGQHAIDSIKTYYHVYNIDFLNRASIPSEPYSPKPIQEAFQALLLGLVFGVGLAISQDQLFPMRSWIG